MNLWNPEHVSITVGLVTALLLGVIHGVTPDEHTWPITFSYAIGSYSSRGGMRAGMFFSAAFTLQRAIGSQLAYWSLASWLMNPSEDMLIYIVVGLVMLASGYFILHRNRTLHLLPFLHRFIPEHMEDDQPVPIRLAMVHGFVAGWGTGAFAIILYTVIAPTMPSAWLGFVPGLLFGIGTTVMQMTIGAAFGRWIESRKLGERAKAFIGRFVAGQTLLYGGVLFAFAGIIGLVAPSVADWNIATGIHVHNLDGINLGLILAIAIVAGVGGFSLWRAMKRVTAPGSKW